MLKVRHIRLLEETSRTFLIPIMRLKASLRDAVGQGYLCLRAIDEIEDHPGLGSEVKASLLNGIADRLNGEPGVAGADSIQTLLDPWTERLPEVSRALPELVLAGPDATTGLIWRYTSSMAKSMAGWVECNWLIRNERDLDQYTYDVAGRVGLLLSDLWRRSDGIESDRDHAIGFGRALQAVNIVRNQGDDKNRGVSFFPEGWTADDMIAYAYRQIALADAYMRPLPDGPIREFCAIPLELARATLQAIASGQEKLTRPEVHELVGQISGKTPIK
jgi:farnesyl-diphosphate farnesyltransferase